MGREGLDAIQRAVDPFTTSKLEARNSGPDRDCLEPGTSPHHLDIPQPTVSAWGRKTRPSVE